MVHGGNVWHTDSRAKWLVFSANLRPEGPPEWVTEALHTDRGIVGNHPCGVKA